MFSIYTLRLYTLRLSYEVDFVYTSSDEEPEQAVAEAAGQRELEARPASSAAAADQSLPHQDIQIVPATSAAAADKPSPHEDLQVVPYVPNGPSSPCPRIFIMSPKK